MKKQHRGFALLTKKKRTEIARQGGLSGGGHRWTSQEATAASSKARSRRKIIDEFTQLPVSRQRKQQLRKRKQLIEESSRYHSYFDSALFNPSVSPWLWQTCPHCDKTRPYPKRSLAIYKKYGSDKQKEQIKAVYEKTTAKKL